jgi:hypothetical protein
MKEKKEFIEISFDTITHIRYLESKDPKNKVLDVLIKLISHNLSKKRV